MRVPELPSEAAPRMVQLNAFDFPIADRGQFVPDTFKFEHRQDILHLYGEIPSAVELIDSLFEFAGTREYPAGKYEFAADAFFLSDEMGQSDDVIDV